MSEATPRGKARYTRTGAEFREVSVAEVTAGFDESTWRRNCSRCPTSIQGGAPALAEHEKQIHGDD